MKARLLAPVLVAILGAVTFTCGEEEEKALEGEACVQDNDCRAPMVCAQEMCIEVLSRNLYDGCDRDLQCVGGTCASGYCTAQCSQYYPTGTYSMGDCVADADLHMCVWDGVGCCYITLVEGASNPNQEHVSGFCTSTP